MASLGKMEKPVTAGYVDGTSRQGIRRARVDKEEAELEELIKQHTNGAQADTEEEDTTAQTPEPVKVTKAETVEPTTPNVDEDSQLSAEERTFKKRYGDLRKHTNTLTQRIKELESKIENGAGNGSIVPPKSEEDVAAWMQKYPDVAAIVEAIADKKAKERFAGAEEKLRRVDEMTAEAQRKKAEQEILAFHDDFYELRESDAFHDWVGEQPKWVQDALYENEDDPQSVVKVLTLYKYEKGLDDKSRKAAEKTAASAVVPKRTRVDLDPTGLSKKIKESDVNKMSMKEYEAKSDEIMEAIRTGNFIYDISGGAR